MNWAVDVQGLSKRYPATTALNGCRLQVATGEVFGLLGPNGAGKTTLIRCLMGFLNPTAGEATVQGFDCRRQSLDVRRQTAYLPGDVRLFRGMNGQGLIHFLSDLHPAGDRRRAERNAARLEVDLSRKVSACSSGMRQKLALAAVLGVRTPLLILDEPTTHLDPTARRGVLDLVREAKQEGRTVLFSSHVMSEVEAACDRVAVLRRGEVVHTECLKTLRRRHRVSARLSGEFLAPPAALAASLSITWHGERQVMIETPGDLSTVLGWLATLPLEEIRVEPVGLQAVYDHWHGDRLDPSDDEQEATL